MPDGAYGGGLGQPGTRITRQLGPDDEVWLYVWQAATGAAALDLVLTMLLLSYTVIGWWSLVVFLSGIGLLIGLIMLVFGRPQSDAVRFVLGNLWLLGGVIGLLVGRQWYAVLASGAQLIGRQFDVLAELPLWAWGVFGLGLLVVAAKVHWKAALALGVIAPLGAVIAFSDGAKWILAWNALKWLLVPYSWPVIGFALLLALVMAKEMLFPSLEWTFQPVSLEELREVGLIGLWMPRLFGQAEENEPEPEEPVVRAEHRDDSNGKAKERYARLPIGERARAFYQAIHAGQPFTLETARKVRLGRRTYEHRIRDVFLARGWLKWKDDQHHDQGLELTPSGEDMVGELVLNDPHP